MESNIEGKLQSGFPLFLDQFKALLKKNMLLSWHNKGACSIQFISSLFFIILLFCIQLAIKLHASAGTFVSVIDPEPIVSPPIPRCEDSDFILLPCFDFAWSGNGSSEIARIVRRIRVNNPGRAIPSSKVKSFRTPEEMDLWLESEPKRCLGALHFLQRNSSVISYGIQTNSISARKRGRYEDHTFKLLIPLQIAAEREIARTLLGDPNFSWLVGLKEFPHPIIHGFSVIGIGGPTFFLATTMFGFVFQVGSLVAEKELHLRQAMSMMGLYESAYWLSWLTWETLLTLFSSLLLIIFGMIFQFNFFLHNSFGVIFLLFFLFHFNMVGFAFMISTFISKSSSSTTVGFAIYIIGFLSQMATTIGFPFRTDYSRIYRVVWALFPPNLLSEAVKQLGDATATSEDPGVEWSNISMCVHRDSRCLPLAAIFKWLITTFFLWFFLAIYLDNIIQNSNGNRKPFFYLLLPSYWTGKGGKPVEGGLCDCRSQVPPLNDGVEDEDILAEETIIREQLTHSNVDPNIAVQICGLTKIYPAKKGLKSCYKCQKPCPYHAIERIWVNFAKDQLFCLLGHNGAGKTTLINCLTGIKTVTSGDALIYGYSIRSSIEMSHIQKIIGVCPQFDILWNALSAQEHLHLYASIKGLPSTSIKTVVERTLSAVKLTNAADIRVGSYSGGMKRRLSVAIALMGDPKLVFLDEPTTGLDPITRRHIWDIIENAKKGRAIVLTTHSMEEADILSDRIAIMSRGKLRCIGTSVRLKSRYGTGYVANITFHGSSPRQGPDCNVNTAQSEPQPELVKQFFKFNLDVVPKEENKSFLTFVIPREKEELLTEFFAELQDKEEVFGISDIQLGLTSLEEVFMNIAQAELDNHFTEEA